MANLSTTAFDETPEDLIHNKHVDLQERGVVHVSVGQKVTPLEDPDC
jgi:hypothetical protein